MRSVLLYKSFYKFFYSLRNIKEEQKLLLDQVRYLQRYNWGFDFLFFFHYTITFADTIILLPFYIYHLKNEFKQKKHIESFF